MQKNNCIAWDFQSHLFVISGDPLFTSVTAANIVEGQLDEKDVDIPINYYAIQALNTGEGNTVTEKATQAWEKYVNQNNGQKGQVTVPQSGSERMGTPGI